MLTRRDRQEQRAIERFISAFVNTYFADLTPNQFMYVDEVYMLIAQRMHELSNVLSIDMKYVSWNDIVKSDIYRALFDKARVTSDLTYRMIIESYTRMNNVANSIIEKAETMSSKISIMENVVKGLEGSLKEKVSASSIKNELVVYDTMGNDTRLPSGTLRVDRRAGCATLAVISSTEVPYTIKNVIVSRAKGYIRPPEFGSKTMNNIDNGYFNSRTFSNTPIFENGALMNPDRILDQDMESSYMVEYNSDSDKDDIAVTFVIEFDSSKIDILNIVADPGDRESVMVSENTLPNLDSVQIHGDGIVSDITDLAVNNIVEMNRSSVGEMESRITHKAPDIFPIGSFYISDIAGTRLTIRLSSDTPQEVYYPEKEVRSSSGSVLYLFNYFETLVLNGYAPPTGYVNPREFYNQMQITSLNQILESGDTSEDVKRMLFRYYVGIKEIQLWSLTYLKVGEAITANLNNTTKTIAAVELFVNEHVPEGTSIEYFISPDNIAWYGILPRSRADTTGGAVRRIVFEGLDPVVGDMLVSMSTRRVYLKVRMTGTGDSSPVLKAYAVRIKYL